MRRIRQIWWGFWAFLIGMCLTMPVYAAEPVTLVFAFQDVDNFPYEIGDGESIDPQKPGITIELLQLVAQRLHFTIEYKRLPWKRCFLEMQKGTVDGVFSASFKPERLEAGAYPMQAGEVDENRKTFSMTYTLYARAGTDIRWNGSAFATPPKKIAAIRGYSIVADLTNMGLTVEEVKDTYVALKWLKAEMFDAAALLELSGDAALTQYRDEFAGIEKVSPPLTTRDYYLMLSHQRVQQSPALAEDIWNAIKIVRESEEFQRIMLRYGKEERSE